ncbi:type I DNA topoisomerase [Sharpea azabuensis]|uniref:DNA topoisomerase 1 n=1 Tax=Sharpea azabuensis TaxID=322505 RepID=A0A1H6QQV7_9FIRM|nr:type I DNA topoisomerase [Sharpea azabuensis]MDD6511906.1 type I DNA topoisomerase [Sharpea azabuensis]MEE3307602.1 type I DNA topoisomerase [Sharpea azabuensis]SEI44386.1 DNA topoisomerase-1 [Sharpea azabuensis]HCJ15168.1 type I DNA topoisomerase [Erysipelotrichaceae bacterium]
MSSLVIVESPSKSKTIGKYLGKDYVVTSSKGHIRDLATSGKGGLGVDVENGYEPSYTINKDKKNVVKELKQYVKDADKVYLATDPDREGEAISWHLAQVLGIPMDEDNRVVFHEVTKRAVTEALQHPRQIDQDLVKSQETRRVLDRIIGFKLSKLLQRKIKSKSAGRVQSVALRLICEREAEINKFVPEEYWSVQAHFVKDGMEFTADLSKYKNKKIKLSSQEETDAVYNALNKEFVIETLKKTVKRRNSKAPFITSTLQQEASTKLGFKAKRTMQVAQSLYEGVDIGSETVGLITYMRTDSIRLAPEFISAAHDYIEENYGKQYVGRVKVSNKTENVQDAHEAIRPTDITRTPESIKSHLNTDQYKLYSLIYARALASLMCAAKVDATSVVLDNNDYKFNASGSRIQFDGYLKVYGQYEKNKDTFLPELVEGEHLESQKVDKEQHFTNPPARYSEAKLIKELEELGIGRPSTYATIIDTIVAREYVEMVDKTFKPTESGMLTNEKLVEYFDPIINVEYTAQMENELDEIANGEDTYLNAITTFENKFEPLLDKANKEMEKIEPKKTGEKCPECGGDLVIRKGRYGEFVACSNYPECKYIKKDPNDRTGQPTGETCPKCGSPMVYKRGRYGEFEACSNYPTCKYIKKKPREGDELIGKPTGDKCPNCGADVVWKRGRFGLFKACSNYPECKTIIKTPKEKK